MKKLSPETVFYIVGTVFLLSLILLASSWVCGLFGKTFLSEGWKTLTIIVCIVSGFCAFIAFLGVALIEGVDQKDDVYRELFKRQEPHCSFDNQHLETDEKSEPNVKSE